MRKLRWSQAVATWALTVLVLSTTSAARRSARVPGPILSVSPTTVSFGTTQVGEFETEFVTIANSGDVGITSARPMQTVIFFRPSAGLVIPPSALQASPTTFRLEPHARSSGSSIRRGPESKQRPERSISRAEQH